LFHWEIAYNIAFSLATNNKVGMTQTTGSQASALDAPQVGERQSFSPLVVVAVDHRRVVADAEVTAASFW
jgi:hypothetical protein